MGANKDRWDKADIIAKSLGAVLIPLVVAGTAFWWNAQNNQRQVSAQMTQIAVGVLQADKTPENAALRSWAVQVLQNPASPPPLNSLAAEQLLKQGLSLAQLYEAIRASNAALAASMANGEFSAPAVPVAPHVRE